MSMLNLDLQVCHSLYSATNALIRAYRPLLEPLGLTYPQYIVMLSLWQNDGVNIKTLSTHTRLDSGTLTPILKRLEKQRLLSRKIYDGDERQKRIVLTTEGKKLKRRAEKIPAKLSCITAPDTKLTGLSDEETRQQQAKNAETLKQLCEGLFQVLQHK
ncbi:MarR family winged helix-turn-helix transcriptional regulator [Aurantivibrio infirmus]